MTDRNGDDAKRPLECQRDKGGRYCPHLKETGGGFEGERYECLRCGERFFLDYEEMK